MKLQNGENLANEIMNCECAMLGTGSLHLGASVWDQSFFFFCNPKDCKDLFRQELIQLLFISVGPLVDTRAPNHQCAIFNGLDLGCTSFCRFTQWCPAYGRSAEQSEEVIIRINWCVNSGNIIPLWECLSRLRSRTASCTHCSLTVTATGKTTAAVPSLAGMLRMFTFQRPRLLLGFPSTRVRQRLSNYNGDKEYDLAKCFIDHKEFQFFVYWKKSS